MAKCSKPYGEGGGVEEMDNCDQTLINGLTGQKVSVTKEPFVFRLPTRSFARAAAKSKAAAVTLVGIYYVAGLAKKSRNLRLPPSRMDEAGATAQIRSKGLSDLSDLGVIEIAERRQGCAPTVSLVEKINQK